MRKITEIIIHCSATPEGREVTVDEIGRWHKQRGFARIGYHYVVYADGAVHVGRPLEQKGAHCLNHNENSIGICYIGGTNAQLQPKDTRTAAQQTALVKLVKKLQSRFPGTTVHGHNEFAAKACPCFNVQQWVKENAL